MQECNQIEGERPALSRRWSGRRGKGGISDIIGTILILAITVTLFSSIFFFVSSLPGPPSQSNSQFTSSLGVSAAGTEAYVNISYTTGPSLTEANTAIYITDPHHAATWCKNPYDVAAGLPGQNQWTAGEVWSLHLTLSPGTTCATSIAGLSSSGDNVTVTIINTEKNVLLFQTTNPGTIANIPPEFLSDGFTPDPVLNTGPFAVWAQIRDDDLKTNSVYANLTTVPGPISGPGYVSKCSCIKMYYNPTNGIWNSSQLSTASTSVIGSSFPITINATDKINQVNSVVVYLSFVAPQGANLQVLLRATPGNPTIHQNTTISATISNSGAAGGLATVTFTASNGVFCPWKPTGCTNTFTLSTPVAPFAAGVVVSAYWNATGALPIGDGTATITASVSLPASVIVPLVITVYPKSVLIDGTGISQGSVSPPDPFTYLAADFVSANIPFASLVAPPGSTTITYAGSSSTALDTYNLIVWDVGNSSSGTCLSSQDASALSTAISNNRAVWMIGGDAFSCGTATYDGAFGISSTASTAAVSPIALSLKTLSNVPQSGYPATMYLGAGAAYSTLSLVGATSYLCNGACGTTNNLATAYNPGGSNGPTVATSFDLATLTTRDYFGAGYAYGVDTGAQASVVYNVFNFLAGFYTAGTPPTNIAHGTDWSVSRVAIEPASLSYQATGYINITVRNNGVYQSPITAELLIDGLPYPSYAPQTVVLTPLTVGGSISGVITWKPTLVGYVTIGAEILPPANDSNTGNNIMYSSLFNVQTYVGYSVLVVDATLHSLSPSGFPDDTNSTVIPSLVAAGYNKSTINETYINTRCGPLQTSLNNYNLVVWNTGSVTNGTGVLNPAPCPLSDTNANLLSSFLVNGGLKSSLLFIGPGLMAQSAPSAADTSFAQTYLGTTITNTLTSGVPTNVFGKTTDPVGNGLNIPYKVKGTGANYTCSLAGAGAGSLYYNTSSSHIDYWTAGQAGTYCAGTDVLGTTGWHSAYWAFNLVDTGTSSQLSLAFLRASTFFGRLLPNSDTVVAPPDITFATATRPWTNFDNMHPELQQQYLIVSNVTNLGASTANNLGISLYDGMHILGSQTLTIGGSTSSFSGAVTLGTGQFSVPWTPLYAGLNTITLKITSSTAGQTLPGVANEAMWNVTVYFFYDATSDNSNAWTHSQLTLYQANVNPKTCDQPSPGSSAYYWDGHAVPKEWPTASSKPVSCSYSGMNYALADTWGMDGQTCYNTQWQCASLAVLDSTSNPNSVKWAFTSPITIPAGSTTATATWWQKYNMATYTNGGAVCITTNPSTLPSGTGWGYAQYLAGCDTNIPGPTPTNNQTTVQVFDGVGTCYLEPVFTGPSAGGTGGWQTETIDLSRYIGSTVYIAFGYVEGDTTDCGSSSVSAQSGWFVDDFKVTVGSSTPSPGYVSGSTSIPTDLWREYSGATLASSLAGLSAGPPPTGSAWVDAAMDGSTVVMDPNMWDSLYSRPIDLSTATNALLNFNYLFSNVWWVGPSSLGPCYVMTADPAQNLELEIAPANTGNWVVVWSANSEEFTGCTGYPTIVGYTPSSYNIYEYYGYIPSGVATVSTWGWRSIPVSLDGYVGQVIQLRFVGGSNNGGDGSPGGESQDTNVAYPMLNGGTAPLPTGGMISGIFVTGNTSISSGPPPAVLTQTFASTPNVQVHLAKGFHETPRSLQAIPPTQTDVGLPSSNPVTWGELHLSGAGTFWEVARWIV